MTENQFDLLKQLREESDRPHPCDAFHTGTLNACIKREWVEKFWYKGYLHGAVKITEKGIEALSGR